MARLKKPLPKFNTEGEEAEFWDKHSPLEFFDESEFEPLRVKRPKDTPITIRLDTETNKELEEVARAQQLGVSTLARKFIIEGLSRQKSNTVGGSHEL
jgi:hypothetical protein